MNKSIFDGSCSDYLMRINGFSCGLNTPLALSGDMAFSLPPYCKRMPYLVDKYPACPADWMRSEGKIKSYFVPVKEGSGMWLDFNDNATKDNHVAVVISVQGINPITGLPCKDAQLEQYIEECPKHKIKFGPDRYCKKCDYKWPKQNYLSTTSTPHGSFWLDGFRSIDGIVRQYILTSDKIKGVANNIIGKDRVFAIGISFFISKEKKQIQTYTSNSRDLLYWPICYNKIHEDSANITVSYNSNSINNSVLSKKLSGSSSYSTEKGQIRCYYTKSGAGNTKDSLSAPITDSFIEGDIAGKSSLEISDKIKHIRQRKVKSSIKCKQLDVSAGAKIKQSIYDDTEKLDFWKVDSEGVLCINYCNEKDAMKIIEQGEINLEGHPEGFLKDIPVGN